MRMSHLASIAFACSISIFATASLAQQSSNDGRCDVLSDDATPSLYGLCIAYWATQENGNSEASSKILEKYDARKSDDDPSMPGVCPATCWTASELVEWESYITDNGGTVTCETVGDTFYWYNSNGTGGAGSGSESLQVTDGGSYFSCYIASIPGTPDRYDDTLDQISYGTCLNLAEQNLCSASGSM